MSGLEGHGALFALRCTDGCPPFGGDYAFGWLATERPWGGGPVYTHAGSNTMNFAVVWLAPLKDFAVLVTTNQGKRGATRNG